MEKPIVFKRRLRLFDWHNGAVILVAALWAWQYARDATAALIWLPSLILINGNAFFRRVVLANDRITIYEMATYGDAHRFERIINYSITEHPKHVGVEVTLEQTGEKKIELFGVELSFLWPRAQSPARNKERIITFSIESEDLDELLNYLRAQGAVAYKNGAIWKANYLAKQTRFLKQIDDLSDEDAAETLREIQEALNKY